MRSPTMWLGIAGGIMVSLGRLPRVPAVEPPRAACAGAGQACRLLLPPGARLLGRTAGTCQRVGWHWHWSACLAAPVTAARPGPPSPLQMCVLMAKQVRGALVVGILFVTFISWWVGAGVWWGGAVVVGGTHVGGLSFHSLQHDLRCWS